MLTSSSSSNSGSFFSGTTRGSDSSASFHPSLSCYQNKHDKSYGSISNNGNNKNNNNSNSDSSSTSNYSSSSRRRRRQNRLTVDRILLCTAAFVCGGFAGHFLVVRMPFFSSSHTNINNRNTDTASAVWKDTTHAGAPSSSQPLPPDDETTTKTNNDNDQQTYWDQIKQESLVEHVEHGAVATDDGRCSDLGLFVMETLGGNAIDAAVTVTLCLGIVNPAGSTPGGGAFVLLHSDAHPDRESMEFHDARKHPYQGRPGEKVTEVIDCRETAPLEATMDMFDNQAADASWTGGLASAVPGQLHCLALMHSRHGSLPWPDVISPVISLARDGIEVTSYLAHAVNLKSSQKKIFDHDNLRMLMTQNHDGVNLLQEGDILTNPALADTLEDIMEQGIDALYKGERARKIEEEFKAVGGIISAKDLEQYRATLRDPLITQPGEVKGFTMVGVPPPSSGGCVVIGAARFLAGYNESFPVFDETLSEHRVVEAMKHGYALRMSLSDPAYFSNITEAAVRDMIEGDFMESLRRITKDNDVLPMAGYGGDKWGILDEDDVAFGKVVMSEEGHDNRRHRRLRGSDAHRNLKGFQYLNDHGTTHISIIDKDGNALTMTTTINTYFGSGIVSPSTGIIFNSQMDDFASPGQPNHYGVEPSPSNYIVTGKKPLSSISPTLVFRPIEDEPLHNFRDLGKQKLVMAFGASGGPKIPTAALQAFVNFAFRGLSLYDAIVRPRLHDQLLYKGFSTTLYDRDTLLQAPLTIETPQSTQDALVKRHHDIAPVTNTGCVQAVSIDMETGLLSAVSDPRKGGRPAGY